MTNLDAPGIREPGIRNLSQPKIRPRIGRLRSLGNVGRYDTYYFCFHQGQVESMDGFFNQFIGVLFGIILQLIRYPTESSFKIIVIL